MLSEFLHGLAKPCNLNFLDQGRDIERFPAFFRGLYGFLGFGGFFTSWSDIILALKKIFYFFCFCIFLICKPAFSLPPPTESQQCTYGSFTGDWQSVCNQIASSVYPSLNLKGAKGTPYWCYAVDSNNLVYFNDTIQCTSANTCPANAGLTSSNTCSCQSGYTEVNNQCVNSNDAPCNPFSDQFGYVQISGKVLTSGSTICTQNVGTVGGPSCSGTFTPEVSFKDKTTGNWVTTGEIKYNGKGCDASGAPASSPTTCKGTPGKINGVDVCIPPSSDNSATTSDTKNNTSNTPDSNGDTKSTSTNTESNCQGSTCTTTTTTTTTTTHPDGTTTQKTDVEKTEEPKPSFCKENPESVLCKQSSFSGGCNTSYACEGDPIQCAIAQDQIKRNCQTLEPDNDQSSIFNKAVNGTDGYSMADLKANAEKINVGSFSFAGRGWSRSCPADAVISLGFVNSQLTIPYSRVCPQLSILSQAAVAITALACLAFCLRTPMG